MASFVRIGEWGIMEARKCVSFARLAKYSPEVSIQIENS